MRVGSLSSDWTVPWQFTSSAPIRASPLTGVTSHMLSQCLVTPSLPRNVAFKLKGTAPILGLELFLLSLPQLLYAIHFLKYNCKNI